ncbi:hypothetical protein BD770DRAFT_450195 [Pilaira anomala]|nr:hypothetical protein BD770DRAFT_450195 [Pilaira anomala]
MTKRTPASGASKASSSSPVPPQVLSSARTRATGKIESQQIEIPELSANTTKVVPLVDSSIQNNASFSSGSTFPESPELLAAIEARFQQYESRFGNMEFLIKENAELKETVTVQASLIAELQARLLATPSPTTTPTDQTQIDDHMIVDVPRDLSSNGSKWKDAPATAVTVPTTTTVPKPR